MITETLAQPPSSLTRSSPSLAIVGHDANVVAYTHAFEACCDRTFQQWNLETRAVVRRLIVELDGGLESATAMLESGRFLRVFPLLGLLQTYVVSIECERQAPNALAIAQRFALSARESEVIRLLMSGATNAEIGRVLQIGETTVASHVRNIGIKLGCSKRSTMVARVLGLSERPTTLV